MDKPENEMSIKGFEKLQPISGNLQGCAHAQERPEKTLSSHLWLPWCSVQAEVETKAELHTVWQSTEGTPRTYTAALGKGWKVIGSALSCHRWQTTKWTQQRLQGLRMTKIETLVIFLDWFCNKNNNKPGDL